MITTRAYARAGLIGNPSDGYFGRTISISVKNFFAEVILSEADRLSIQIQDQDRNEYEDVIELTRSIQHLGYYGGARLIKASIMVFVSYCKERGIQLHDRPFSVRYKSAIPRQIGLAGSSGIIIAMLRALMKYYDVAIEKHLLANIALSAEFDELGITAGLQDRVIQIFEGCVQMDFNQEMIEKNGYGVYEPISIKTLPNLFIAYHTDLSKVSGAVLNNIRSMFQNGDPHVVRTLKQIADLVLIARKAINEHDFVHLAELMNENFRLRSQIMTIRESDKMMISFATECGASAKFAGSGGSIIGIYKDQDMLSRLKQKFNTINASVIEPTI